MMFLTGKNVLRSIWRGCFSDLSVASIARHHVLRREWLIKTHPSKRRFILYLVCRMQKWNPRKGRYADDGVSIIEAGADKRPVPWRLHL
ncbi:hypothetical protein CS542_08015 [Pedobacter sp. IW39]|nr:hypothetical protein CS542_08015 [Pedobacter sp. IW39]